jgi:RNA polymerase sigma factor (sigma-70 family)
MPPRLTTPRLVALPQPADTHLLRAHIDGDPNAFAEMVRRYAGLATRVAVDVCPSTADDVVQATVALLSRKAATVAARESVAGWVFETARRLAHKSRTAAARRAKHEARAVPPTRPANPLDALSFREVRAAVAEELARLPDELQAPLVLCYWDGLTGAAAADRLGCSISTLKRRLDTGRDRLAARLTRRGFAGASVLAALTGLQAMGRATAPVGVFAMTVTAPREISAGAAALLRPSATGPLAVMFAVTAALLGAMVLAISSPLTGAGSPAPPSPKSSDSQSAPAPLVDAFGDPLPPGAVARLGSVRFRTADFPKLLSVSPDGKRLVSATGHLDSRFAIWEADTGRLIREVQPRDYPKPEAIRWLPDGRGLAAYKTGAKEYVVWEFTDPEAKLPVGDQTDSFGPGTFSASAFSPDGTLLAGGERAGPEGTAGKLQVWPVHPGRPVHEAEPRFTVEKPDGFVALSFTRDGKRLVGITCGREPNRMPKGLAGPIEPGAAAEGSQVFVWDVSAAKELMRFEVPSSGWGGGFTSLMVPHAVSPDGKMLFTAPRGGHVKAFDLATGKERFDAPAFGPAEGAMKESMPDWKGQATELAVTPDGKTVIAAEMPGRTAGLDAATGKVLWRGGREIDSIYGLTVFPDSKLFALGHGARQVSVYDVATGKQLVGAAGHRGGMSTIRIAANGKSAMSAGWDNVLFRWDLLTGRELGRVEAADKVRVAAFSPDGRRAIANEGLLDPTTGKILAPLTLPHVGWFGIERAGRVAWLPDGSVVVAEQENLAVRYAADGKRLTEYVVARPGKPRTGPQVVGVAAAPDGKTVVLVGEGASPPAPDGGLMMRSDTGWVAVFDAATGAKTREWESKGSGPASGFTGAAFLPDGSRVVLSRWHQHSRSADQAEAAFDLAAGVVLFDPATGAHLTPFDAPDQAAQDRMVNSVAVSPSGRQFVAVEWDLSLTVYETASGAIRRRLRGHRGPVAQVAFAPDGARLVSVSDDGTGLVWDMSPPRPAGPASLSDADRFKRWATLLTAEAEAAHRAMGELAADAAGTVTFLKTHLKPTSAPTDADLDRLMARLGAAAFADREAASRDLDSLGTLAVPKVRARRPDVSSAEVRQRVDDFLKRHDRPGRTTGARLRELRAVELLESIATPESRAMLDELAKGDSALARVAAAAVKRLKGK